jgi:hypothetical protein
MAMLATTSAAWATHNPHLGRFMQRDPAGYVEGMSLHEYCGSKSVASTDPTGRTSEGGLHVIPAVAAQLRNEPLKVPCTRPWWRWIRRGKGTVADKKLGFELRVDIKPGEVPKGTKYVVQINHAKMFAVDLGCNVVEEEWWITDLFRWIPWRNGLLTEDKRNLWNPRSEYHKKDWVAVSMTIVSFTGSLMPAAADKLVPARRYRDRAVVGRDFAGKASSLMDRRTKSRGCSFSEDYFWMREEKCCEHIKALWRRAEARRGPGERMRFMRSRSHGRGGMLRIGY